MSDRARADAAARRMRRIIDLEGSELMLILTLRDDLVVLLNEYQGIRSRVPALCGCEQQEESR